MLSGGHSEDSDVAIKDFALDIGQNKDDDTEQSQNAQNGDTIRQPNLDNQNKIKIDQTDAPMKPVSQERGGASTELVNKELGGSLQSDKIMKLPETSSKAIAKKSRAGGRKSQDDKLKVKKT